MTTSATARWRFFAALSYLSGKVFGLTAARHTHKEWLAFLKLLDRESPPELALHLILDNYATHKHAKVRAWLARHPRFHLHFTPTASSWLNLVERFFADLTADVVCEGNFGSVPALVAAMETDLAQRNLAPQTLPLAGQGCRQPRQNQPRQNRAVFKSRHIVNVTPGSLRPAAST